MNERDELLLKYIMGNLDRGVSGPLLFDVASTQFVRMNLVILKGMLEERGMTGMFISVDRPHQYMVHLLRMHKISLDSVMFIDAIGRFSADRKEAMASVGFVDAPFHIDTLPVAMGSIGTKAGKKIDLDDLGFAMIDNLAALLPYNSYASVETFLRNFVGVMERKKGVIVPLVIDKEKNGLLYETARTMAVKEMDLKSDQIPTAVENKSVRKITDINIADGGFK